MIVKKNTTSRLRHRLTLQHKIQSPDDAGGFNTAWHDIADLWGEISIPNLKSFYGFEKLLFGKIQSEISHKITIRYRSGISTSMRLLFDNRIFNIRAINNLYENNEILELLVDEGVAT
jgi:SPP1 family predicted phage head-tail adaptor